ncbi:MAG: ABC transporter ATP-binding protein [Alphaproteobacteria bacterium]|nr:ABC transporter ATP-binding protein [Alphaproteobacteria bacterium]
MAEPVLQVRGLSKQFGGLLALCDVNLQVERGEFRAIIGPNGAGKSTFFNTLSGWLKANAGRVLFEGRDITGHPPHRLTRGGIARTFQITSVFAGMSVLENVQVAILGYRGQTWRPWTPARTQHGELARELLERVGLAGEVGRQAGTLSHGDQKRLELAIALAGNPRLLLLDEPTAGMTARERLESIHLVHRIAGELGLTVVFTEHDMAVVFAVASHISVLHQGRLLAEGTPEAVRANPEVQQVYLGEAVIESEQRT